MKVRFPSHRRLRRAASLLVVSLLCVAADNGFIAKRVVPTGDAPGAFAYQPGDRIPTDSTGRIGYGPDGQPFLLSEQAGTDPTKAPLGSVNSTGKGPNADCPKNVNDPGAQGSSSLPPSVAPVSGTPPASTASSDPPPTAPAPVLAARSIPANAPVIEAASVGGAVSAGEGGSALTASTPTSSAGWPGNIAPAPASGYPTGVTPAAFGTGLNPSDPTSPIRSPAADNVFAPVAQAATIAQTQQRGELLDNAYRFMDSQRHDALQDSQTLAEQTRAIPTRELPQTFQRAVGNIFDDMETLSHPVTGLDRGGAAFYRNSLANAADKAQEGMNALNKDLEDASAGKTPSVPFPDLTNPMELAQKNPFARTPATAELFNTPVELQNATSTDAQIDRIIMFHGLTPEQQAAVAPKLKMAEFVQPAAPGALPSKKIVVLHNGYILGSGRSGVDCSAFVSAILPPDVRKARFTTLDFYSMWVFTQSGRLPSTIKYEPSRAQVVRNTADAFIPVNVAGGDALAPGDLLISRSPLLPEGHVFLVRSYNPTTMIANVIEAAQSGGNIREREYPLTLDGPDVVDRMIRPGLFGLRLKPRENRTCNYKQSDRATASAAKGGR